MRIQTETISWTPTEGDSRPDVEKTVLICTDDGELSLGFWDDDFEEWFDFNGDSIANAVYWAEVEGPMV